MNQPINNERAMDNAAASIEMEGFIVTAQYRELCKKLLNKEITLTEYIKAVTESKEVRT